MTEVRLGDKRIPFIYQGDELIHPAPIKDGLILWYDFSAMANSDVSKGVAKDLSGNGHDGTLQNFNYTDESGYVGDGLNFDGVDDYAEITTIESSDDTGSETVEVVFNTTIQRRQIIVSKHHYNFDFAIEGSKFFAWYGVGGSYVGGYQQGMSDDTFANGENHLITVVFERLKGKISLYVNGEYYFTIGPDIESSDLGYFDVSLYVGGRPRGGLEFPFVGDIYSTRIYNRPLTAEEIQHNYQLERERFL